MRDLTRLALIALVPLISCGGGTTTIGGSNDGVVREPELTEGEESEPDGPSQRAPSFGPTADPSTSAQSEPVVTGDVEPGDAEATAVASRSVDRCASASEEDIPVEDLSHPSENTTLFSCPVCGARYHLPSRVEAPTRIRCRSCCTKMLLNGAR